MSWIGIILTFALVDNVILSRLLGVEPEASARASLRAAAGIGGFTTLVMAGSALAGWALETLVLAPLGFTILRTPAFVFLVAATAFLLREVTIRLFPGLLNVAGISLPEIAVNCAILGVVLIVSRGGSTALESIVAGLAAGLGYFMVNALMAAIRERLEIEPVPRALRGLPLHLISAGLMAYAFMAFDRTFLARVLGG